MKSMRYKKLGKTVRRVRRGRTLRVEPLELRVLLAADSLEPNDDFAQASLLGTGDQTHDNLSIHESGNNDWYQWTASADGLLRVDVRFIHGLGDLDLELYDPDQVLRESSFTVDDNEQLEWQVAADEKYFIRVWGFADSVQDNYSLEIDGPDPALDALEPNDSFAEARILGSGDQTRGDLTIHQPGNDDWYEWSAPTDGSLSVDVIFSHSLGDVNLQLYDANQNLLEASTSTTSNEQALISVTRGESYFVRVYGASGDIHRGYDLVMDGPDIPPDAWEPNDSFAASSDLQTEDQTHSGLSIHEAGNNDLYKWTSTGKGTLTVDILFNHSFGDLNLELYDAGTNLLASSLSTSDNEQVSREVVAGELFFIRVFGSADAAQSNYTLAIDGPEPLILEDILEPNNTFASAFDLRIGDQTRRNLTIHASHDDDWYKWTASENGQLTVDVRFIHAFGDVNVELYDATVTRVVASNSTTDNEQFTTEVVAGEKYVIRVFGASGDLQRNYDLLIDGPEIQPDNFEPNENFVQAFDLGTRDQTHQDLTIHEPGDDDWYKWTPSRDGTLTVELRFTTGLGDLDLELYNSDQQLLTTSASFTDDEQLSWEATAGQTYVIHVFAFGNAVQPMYDLVVNGPSPDADGFEPNDSISTPFDLGTGDMSHKGLTIHNSGNDDWYSWSAPVDGPLTVEVLFAHMSGDVNLELYDAGMNLLAESTSTTDNEEVSLDVVAGQDYLVRVFAVAESIQPKYDLVINGPGPQQDTLEPNDELAAAFDLATGDKSIKALTIHGPNNDDWYKWTASADGSVTVEAFFIHSTGDVNLELYDADENLIAESNSTTDNERIDSNAVAGSTFFIRVFGEGGVLQDRYDLVIQSNDPPTISGIPKLVETNEDTETPAIPFLVSDDETEPGSLTLSASSSNTALVAEGGIVFDGGEAVRTMSLSPAPGQSGQSTITITVRDEEGGVSTSAFEFVVNAVADPPNLTVGDAQGREDAPIALTIESSLVDQDGSETLAIEITDVPLGATLSAGSDNREGRWTLMPTELDGLTVTLAEHHSGVFTLSVAAISAETSNNDMGQVTSGLVLKVDAVADPPLLTVPDVAGEEDTAIPLGIDSSLVDVDGSESLVVVIDGMPAGATLSAGVSDTDGSWTLSAAQLAGLTLTPPPDSSDDFTLRVTATATEKSNGEMADAVETGTVSITPVNDAPTLPDMRDQTTDEDTPTDPITFHIDDVESPASSLTLAVTSNNQRLLPDANISIDGNDSRRTLTMAPAANQIGTAIITIEVEDEDGASTVKEFILAVNSINDAPMVVSPVGSLTTDEDAADTTIDLSAVFRDVDVTTAVDMLTYSILSNDNATLVDASVSAETLTLRQQKNQNGSATIVVLATDAAGLFVTDTISLNVTPINDVPVHSVPVQQTTDNNTTLVFSTDNANAITIADIDAGSADVVVVIVVLEGTLDLLEDQGLTVTGQGSRSLTIRGPIEAINAALDGLVYTPGTGFRGIDRLTIITDDLAHAGSGGALVDTDTVEIVVNPLNVPPRITSGDQVRVIENSTAVMTVTATDSDGDLLRFSIDGGADRDLFAVDSTSGALRFNSVRDFEAPEDADGNNVYDVQVAVDDGKGGIARQLIHVTVTDLDEIPPTVNIVAVSPDPRAGAVNEIVIQFSEPVPGFDLNDIRLTRSTDDTVSLLPGSASLTTSDNVTWTLADLEGLTAGSGIYQLTLSATDAAGNPLADSATESWINGAGDANQDGKFDQHDLIAVLQAATYLNGRPANWSQGDWNGDNVFNQFDIIFSQQTQPPHYLQGPFVATADVLYAELAQAGVGSI